MPKILRASLSRSEHEELERRWQASNATSRLRERLLMIALSDRGWSNRAIADHLNYNEFTVRRYINAYLAGGVDGLYDTPRAPRPPSISPFELFALTLLRRGAHVRSGVLEPAELASA